MSRPIIMNPVRPGGGIGVGNPTPAPKLPTATQLTKVLNAWKRHFPNQELPFKTKKPSGTELGTVTIQKAPKDRPGQSITAHVLKGNKVYFEVRNMGYRMPPPRPGLIVNPPPPSYFEPRYFGPVSSVAIPKKA